MKRLLIALGKALLTFIVIIVVFALVGWLYLLTNGLVILGVGAVAMFAIVTAAFYQGGE